jgi:hypothetical protein
MSFHSGSTLADMNSGVLLLFGAMLASTAWSQQPTFDLRSDSIKKIVHDTAATQSALVQLSNEKPVERKPIADIEFAPPVAKPPLKYPTRLPDPAPPSTGFLSTLIDTLLDVDDDYSMQWQADNWISCQARDDLKAITQSSTCPGAYPKNLRKSAPP